MSHSRLRARLNDYVDRELPGTQRAEVSAHLKQCQECAAEVRELDQAVALLRRLPEPALPPGFADAVIERVRAGESEPSWLGSLRGLLQPMLTVTATAALAGLAVFTVVRSDLTGGETAPPLQTARIETPAPTTTRAPATVAPRPAVVVPTAAESSEHIARAPRADGVRAVKRQMRRQRRALELAQQGHGDVLARSLRGAGHPHSATLAAHFSEPDSFQLIVPAHAVGVATLRR